MLFKKRLNQVDEKNPPEAIRRIVEQLCHIQDTLERRDSEVQKRLMKLEKGDK